MGFKPLVERRKPCLDFVLLKVERLEFRLGRVALRAGISVLGPDGLQGGNGTGVCIERLPLGL